MSQYGLLGGKHKYLAAAFATRRCDAIFLERCRVICSLSRFTGTYADLGESSLTQASIQGGDGRPLATIKDVTDVLGEIDDATLSAIMDLRPTIADVEEASVWMSGDRDVFGAGAPLKDVAGEIVSLLGDDEADLPPEI